MKLVVVYQRAGRTSLCAINPNGTTDGLYENPTPVMKPLIDKLCSRKAGNYIVRTDYAGDVLNAYNFAVRSSEAKKNECSSD